ncbi:hypothetical protein GA0115256_13548 [Streptomyces sp. DconLS]|nr:hypothetical protein GA0115256_13548 [Streptomyces sp. DconLS]SCF98230.1 hypothetical protein GA0115258_12155 [Streptomyces sp. LamerLS-31b]
MTANGQFATAKINEGHFPHAFNQALQNDPGAITQAYVYAVTVSGKQSIAWKGSPAGGAESRSTTSRSSADPITPVPWSASCRPSRRAPRLRTEV